MGFPKNVRLHYGKGSMKMETFANFCRANGNLSRRDGALLLASWVADGSLKRRPDGGFDVIKAQPRRVGPTSPKPLHRDTFVTMMSAADAASSHNDLPDGHYEGETPERVRLRPGRLDKPLSSAHDALPG